jgi:hypothetical protein
MTREGERVLNSKNGPIRIFVSIKRKKFMENLSLWRYRYIDTQGGKIKVDEKVN